MKRNGVRETLTELRSTFLIIKERQAVKDVLFKCVICKKMLGKAFSTSPTPPLRTSRDSDDLVFNKVGGDFARPLYVMVGRRTRAILPCLRAPALELSTLNLLQTCLRIHLYEF